LHFKCSKISLIDGGNWSDVILMLVILSWPWMDCLLPLHYIPVCGHLAVCLLLCYIHPSTPWHECTRALSQWHCFSSRWDR